MARDRELEAVSQEEKLRGLGRLQRLEQNLSRGILLVGMALLAVVAVSSEGFPDLRWVLGILALMVGGKLLILVLGWQLGWKGWPALLLEAAGLSVAGVLAGFGKWGASRQGPGFYLVLLLLAALFMGARFVRWRANRLLQMEVEELDRLSA